jgi:hypothetical protein
MCYIKVTREVNNCSQIGREDIDCNYKNARSLMAIKIIPKNKMEDKKTKAVTTRGEQS